MGLASMGLMGDSKVRSTRDRFAGAHRNHFDVMLLTIAASNDRYIDNDCIDDASHCSVLGNPIRRKNCGKMSVLTE